MKLLIHEIFIVAYTILSGINTWYTSKSSVGTVTAAGNDDEYDEPSIDQLLSARRPERKPGWGPHSSSLGIVKVEHDILLSTEHQDLESSSEIGINKCADLINSAANRWPKAVVPYVVSAAFSNEEIRLLYSAMKQYHMHTCVRFRSVNELDKDYVEIVNTNDCSSYVGRCGRAQMLSLAGHCHKGELRVFLHELGHAIGLQHEHNRPDRDDYVVINETNIAPEKLHNFQKTVLNETEAMSVDYSYLSIMHYSNKVFSLNKNSTTIIPKKVKYEKHMGMSKGLTFEVVKLINNMYNCSANCSEMDCPGEGFVGQNCECWCPSMHSNLPAAPCFDQSEVCGSAMFAVQRPRFIKSPGYPNQYPNRLRCLWTLRTTSGSGSIALHFVNFSTEECCDQLVIYDNSGLETKISGIKDTFNISVGSRVTVWFTSDDLTTSSGFLIKFFAMEDRTTRPKYEKSSQNLQAVLPPLPVPPERFVANSDSYSFTDPTTKRFDNVIGVLIYDGHILMVRNKGVFEFCASSGQLLIWRLQIRYSYGVAFLSDGRLAFSTGARSVTVFKRQGYSDKAGDKWTLDRHLETTLQANGPLSVHGEIMAALEYPLSGNSHCCNKIELINMTSGIRITILNREYYTLYVVLTSQAIITTSGDHSQVLTSSGSMGHVVDAHSRESDRRLWRYELHANMSRVYAMCADSVVSVLYILVYENLHEKVSPSLVAISLEDGRELRRDALTFNGLERTYPHSMAIGRISGHSVLVVLHSREQSVHSYDWFLTLHASENA